MIQDIVFSEAEIYSAIDRMADEIAKCILPHDKDWHLIAILLGAMPFASALMTALAKHHCHPILDALWLSSYADARLYSGQVDLRADMVRPVSGKSVLLLDDVFETGNSLEFAATHCQKAGAKIVKRCALIKKRGARKTPLDYFGLEAPDDYLVGFGLDDAGRFRGLSEICTIGAMR